VLNRSSFTENSSCIKFSFEFNLNLNPVVSRMKIEDTLLIQQHSNSYSLRDSNKGTFLLAKK